MSSLFSKIINGELPCTKILEDEYTLAILTIEPIQLGHTLVIPKIEVDKFYDVEEPYYSRVFENAQIIARALQVVTKCVRVGATIQGFEVPHFHLHLVPMYDPSDLSFSKARKRPQSEMQSIGEKIVQQLNKFGSA